MDCIFCKIIAGEIPSQKVYEDDFCYAFNDIAPQAKVHILLIPKKHIANISDAQVSDQLLLGHLMLAAAKIARIAGISESGYRLITCNGKDGGQTVYHMHLHILGGEDLGNHI